MRRTITFKPDADIDDITHWLHILEDMGKVRDSSDFPKQITVAFDDASDYLSFLVDIGAAAVTKNCYISDEP